MPAIVQQFLPEKIGPKHSTHLRAAYSSNSLGLWLANSNYKFEMSKVKQTFLGRFDKKKKKKKVQSSTGNLITQTSSNLW